MPYDREKYLRYREYNLRYAKEYTRKNKDKIAEWKRQYRIKNRVKIAEYKKKRREEESRKWHENALPNVSQLAEELVIEKILPSMGFTDIFRPSKDFYFDTLARKNGKICAIEVTTHQRKTLKKYRIRFLEYFGLPFFMFFVKPDYSRYFVIKQTPMVYHSSFHYKQGEEREYL